MSRYEAYPEYRGSGVEWLGEIPANWVATRLKRVISKLESGVSVNASDVPAQEGEIGVLKTSCVYTRSFRPSENKAVFPEEVRRVKCPVRNGAVIISRMNTPDLVGASALVECEAENLYLPDRLWQTESLSLVPKFVAYFMMVDGFRTQISLAAEGASSSMQNIAKENYLAIHVAHPISRLEQAQIAAFLDHETAKIDALIEKQQRLIELLKEKRQAVISHAVTEGLNPNAPMKDSGVEWVDAVPTHWRVTKLSYHASVSNGATPSRENILFWENGTIGWLNSSKVNDETIEEADQFITELALSKTSVKPVTKGDLVIAITGEGQTRGRVAICNIAATINQHLASISIYDKALKHEFLYLWLEGNYERIRYESEGAGSTKGAITCSEIGSFPAIIPPLEEQDQIVSYVKERKLKFDNLVRNAISAIELMQERRTALISAAVTGKIDVRDWQPATEQGADMECRSNLS